MSTIEKALAKQREAKLKIQSGKNDNSDSQSSIKVADEILLDTKIPTNKHELSYLMPFLTERPMKHRPPAFSVADQKFATLRYFIDAP